MLFERSVTKRVLFSAPERPFRSSTGDVALIFSFCYFILLHQGKRKSKSIRMGTHQPKKKIFSKKVLIKTHPHITKLFQQKNFLSRKFPRPDQLLIILPPIQQTTVLHPLLVRKMTMFLNISLQKSIIITPIHFSLR